MVRCMGLFPRNYCLGIIQDVLRRNLLSLGAIWCLGMMYWPEDGVEIVFRAHASCISCQHDAPEGAISLVSDWNMICSEKFMGRSPPIKA